MPTFLADPPQSLYLFLGFVLIVVGAVWFNKRTRKTLVVFVGVLVVVALVVAIDMLSESPREEAVRRVQAMVKAADVRNPEDFLSHLADKIEYVGEQGSKTITRDQIRKSGFWDVLRQYDVHVAAWDFSREDVKQIDANTVEIGFLAKGEAQGKPYPMYFRATFARQPEGQMKLTALASFDPMKRQNERKSIPYFP